MGEVAETGPPVGLFVYGTLKRGEINHHLVAPAAERIQPAWVPGTLYDLGDFPALGEGDGRVWGELLYVAPVHQPAILTRVDRLERYDPADEAHSLYLRRTAAVTLAGGQREPAWIYRYNPVQSVLPPLAELPIVAGGIWQPGPPERDREGLELARYRDWVRAHGGSDGL